MSMITTAPVPPGYTQPQLTAQTPDAPTVRRASVCPPVGEAYCFGLDRLICDGLKNITSKGMFGYDIDIRPACCAITNFLCIFLAVSALVVLLGVGVYGLLS
jgi:hypothetical protein